jgi:hypothetical protein
MKILALVKVLAVVVALAAGTLSAHTSTMNVSTTWLFQPMEQRAACAAASTHNDREIDNLCAVAR